MPCRDYDDENERNADIESTRATRLQQRCDELAKLLCMACAAIEELMPEDSRMDDVFPYELKDWWDAHRQADRVNLLELLDANIDELSTADFNIIDKILGSYADK